MNLDEKGFDGESMRPKKVIVNKLQKHVNFVFDGFRQHFSVLAIVSADGFAIPPLFSFQGKEIPIEIIAGGPKNSKATVNEAGYFNQELFPQVLEHFNQFTSTIPRPILIIMDNANSHLSEIASEFAKTSGIIMQFLPPQTTHRMQPLDVAVFKPFSDYWKTECRKFRNNHNNHSITRHDVASTIKPAWEKCTIPSTIESGFRNTGIFPFNPTKITSEDMKPAEIFQKSPLDNNNNNNNNSNNSNNSNNNTMDVDTMTIDQLKRELIESRQRISELSTVKPKKSRAKTLKHSTNKLLSSEQLHKQHERQQQTQQRNKQRKRKHNQHNNILQNPPKFQYNLKSIISNNNDSSRIILTRIK